MNTKKYHLDNYRKFLLNRVTASPHIIEYIESCLASEDDAAPHSFHKIMVHNWSGNHVELFEALSEYFGCMFIPVNYTSQGDITTFYTSSLTLIMKIAKLDFMFPHQRNMFNVDILFNDKTSADCFENRVTIESIVAGVVSSRFNEKFELDLSNFSMDPEFIQKKIHFYKLTLLSIFKILMLRMGRDTKVLNLSNNMLSQTPVEILNFFIKGDLIAIKLSDNEIPSLAELQRISSKIEKLWIEGNPLCENIDPITYVKQILVKFPRLVELSALWHRAPPILSSILCLLPLSYNMVFLFDGLCFYIFPIYLQIKDGIRLNEHGIALPFYRNYMETPDKKTRMLVEKFLSLYFAHYDSMPRRKIEMFYDIKAVLTVATSIPDENLMPHYAKHSRNMLCRIRRPLIAAKKKLYSSRDAAVGVLVQFPECTHDPTTFTVDVLKHDNKSLILVLDGLYKEKSYVMEQPERYFQFRRTFVFNIVAKNSVIAEYFITNEMFNICPATEEQISNSFKNSTRTTNPLSLKNPEAEDMEAYFNVFSHLTQLKRPEVELRLKMNGWDMRKALKEFLADMKFNKVSPDSFIEEDDFSDTSSLMDDDID